MTFYDLIVHAGYPLRRWARLEVHGRERLPREGPLIIAANHDSMVDPLAVAAACHPARYVRFLAMAELWNSRILRFILDRMGQIPVERGGGGAKALTNAIHALQNGETICIFLEGKLSRGQKIRARRGLAQLTTACPNVPIMLAAVTGADDIVRFPKRPRARVSFLTPIGSETIAENDDLPQRLLDQVRAVAPPVPAGRRGRLASHLRERRVHQRNPSTPAREHAHEKAPS